MLGAAAALAQPIGASVVAGQAQVSSSGATTVVNQSTSKAIINWQSFSVGQGGSVQFNQPSSSAITLNRVTGTSASTIDGAIRANGQVWLLNPNGLLFGNGATINVGGLLATTSDIADQDFMAGRYNFTSAGGAGGITNSGSIKASNGGSVVLSSPSVTNKGIIRATAGHVVLGGTDTFTVDFNGDHLLSYAVSTSGQTGQVTNSGKIAAAGGQILLTARAAAGVQDAVINNTGMIEATSIRSENGEIILDAGDGTATSSGILNASGKAAGQTGGTVKVLGAAVAVTDGANINVSGDAGGGTALIGGNLHGAGPEPNALNTTVGHATINASAITSGNGGTVAVYSIGHTEFAGTITAQGGIVSGNGGMVETSGHTLHVAEQARVVTLAPHGTPGDWLLDPDNITISSGEGSPPNQTFSTTGSVTVGANSINNALVSGNVTLQANVDINVNAAINATTNNTLELDAGHSIILNASITNLGTTGGTIILYAGNPNATGGSQTGAVISAASGATLTANSFGLAVGTAGGGIGTSSLPLVLNGTNSTTNIGIQVNTSGGDVFLNSTSPTTICNCVTTPSGGTFLSTIGGVNLGTGNFTLMSATQIGQNFGIKANNITLTATGSGASITLNDAGGSGDNGNDIGGIARFNATGNVLFLNGAIPEEAVTDVGASTIGGSLNVNSPNSNLILGDTSGSISVGGPATLVAIGPITQTIPLTSAGLLASVGNQGVFLTNPANAVSGTSTFQVPFDGGSGASFINSVATTLGASSIGAGTFSITSGGNLGISGPVAAPGGVVMIANGNISQTSGGAITAATAVLTAQGLNGSINLSAASNAIGTATLFAVSTASLFDTSSLTVLRVQGTTGSTSIPTGPVTIQDSGNLTLASSGSGATLSSGAIAVLHAGGSIFGGTGTAASAPSLSLIADSGSIGMPTAPLNIATNLLAARASSGISLSAAPVSGTALTLTTITSGGTGLIGNTTNTGLSAGTGNIAIAGNGANSFSGSGITASNLRLTGFTTINASNASIASLSAAASSNITVSTLNAFQISNLSGGVGISTPGTVTLNTLGTITSASGTAGSIAAGGLTASVNTPGGSGLFLGDGSNAVTGSVTLNAPGSITFFNSVNTNIFRANYIPASTALPAQSVDIEAIGASTPTLTIGAGINQNGTSINGNTVTLRGMGGILQSGTGAVAGSTITLFSGLGSIGTGSAPIRVQAGGSLVATTVNKDINLAVTLPPGVTSSTIGLGAFITTNTTSVNPNTGVVGINSVSNLAGISAGTGNINISAPSVLVLGNATITAGSLNISSSAGVVLGDVEVNSFSAAASGGNPIALSSVNGFQLSNPRGGPAISTTGDVALNISTGALTQASGASGAIIAGTFSSFAVGGNNLNNAANAISSNIEIGSLANTTLVNSLTTNLVVALASGTLTVQSAGDLVIVASPTIAGLAAASASSGSNFQSTGSETNGSGNGGISINGANVVPLATLLQLNGNIVSLAGGGDGIVLAAGGSFINNAGATALLVPNGARFLVYANQFSTSVLGGLTTVGDGIFNTSYPTPITASGSRFVFAGSGSLSFTTPATPATPVSTPVSVPTVPTVVFTPSDVLHDNTTTAPVVIGFVTAQQLPARSPSPASLLLNDVLTVVPPPPAFAAPSPPPVESPLADNNSEQPTSSDQTTSQVANSLDGNGPAPGPGPRGSSGVLIPRMLASARPPAPPPLDTSVLSSFGNSSLWQ